jgi:chaperone modulatory protein CbpM
MTSPRWPLVVLAPSQTMSLEGFAQRAGLHPELVRRFVALGLVEARRDAAGGLRFAPSQLAVVGQIRRLHTMLPLNYAAIGVVLDLLERIRQLESTRTRSEQPWI